METNFGLVGIISTMVLFVVLVIISMILGVSGLELGSMILGGIVNVLSFYTFTSILIYYINKGE